MAATVAQKHRWISGDRVEGVFDVTLDNSYPTGGYALTAGSFGLMLRVDSVVPQNTGGRNLEWDAANGKLKAYSAYATEYTAGTDLSAMVIRCRVVGK